MAKGCPIYSSSHLVVHQLKQQQSSSDSRRRIETKKGISPALNGVFLVLALNATTMAQIGEDQKEENDQTEDGGADTAAHNEENRDRRIARRIPDLMKDVWEKEHENVMKICGFLQNNSYDPKSEVYFMREGMQMKNLNVTHAIYEDSEHNLKEYLEKETTDLDRKTMFQWAFQLISAVEHLHNTVGVMHRRINPAAIYVFESKDGKKFLKLGNILFARKPAKSGMTAEKDLPIAYAAPETISCGQTASYGSPADIWSYGMVLYFIAYRRDPYLKEDTRNSSIYLRDNILKKDIRPDLETGIGKDIDESLKGIIRDCWQTEATTRPTPTAIKERLATVIRRMAEE